MSTRTYDPKKFAFSFAGIPLNSGIAPDTFFKAERDEEGFTKQVGSAGEVTRTRNNNKGGKVTFTTMAASQVNDALMAIAAADELLGTGVVPLFGKEHNGTTVVLAAEAWIQKMPTVERGKEAGTVEWVIDCAELELFVGGLLS